MFELYFTFFMFLFGGDVDFSGRTQFFQQDQYQAPQQEVFQVRRGSDGFMPPPPPPPPPPPEGG